MSLFIRFLSVLGVFLVLISLSLVQGYESAGPTFLAKDYTNWNIRRVDRSRRAEIQVNFPDNEGNPDYINLIRLDLVGNATARGYAQGALLAREIVEFVGPQMDKVFASYILDLDISEVPEPLQSILKVLKIGGAVLAPKVFKEAMQWVWEQEEQFVPQALIDEMEGLAAGMCSVLPECDVENWKIKIKQFNMFPELIRMACSAYGAWGKATPNGDRLIQLRALDFGTGPFSNYTIVTTHRENPDNDNAFVSVTYPALIGAITGISQHGIGISEKVWMTYGHPQFIPGSYQGLADVFVLRNILEYSKNRVDAENYLATVPRTWGIWITIGDYDTMKADIIGYSQASADVYTDQTIGTQTGLAVLNDLVYIDKHPQPTHDTNLQNVLTDFYGNVTAENTKTIAKAHNTGDAHIAIYDYKEKTMLLAIGRIDAKGDYGPNEMYKACNRPYVSFSLEDLWRGR